MSVIAYALCLYIGTMKMCVPITAEECKESERWYKSQGYTVTCTIADQPLTHLNQRP